MTDINDVGNSPVPTAPPNHPMTTPDGMPKDAGNQTLCAGTTTEAIAKAINRLAELASDVDGQGGTVGDLMPLPNVESYGSYNVHGMTEPTG